LEIEVKSEVKICPLCGSSDVQDEEIVSSEEICKVHKKGLGVDPSYLFTSISSLTLCKCKNCDLGFYFPFVSGDSGYYSSLGENDWYYGHEGKEEFEYAASYIKKGQKVLDVGAGIGRFGKSLSGVDYLGIDLSDYACSKAQADGVNVIKKDLFVLAEEKPGYFDVVVSFQVIEHVSSPKEFIKVMKTLLKPDGLLILAVPNSDSKLFMTENISLNAPPRHLLLWNKSSLQWIAGELGMGIEKIYTENVHDSHLKWLQRAQTKILLSKIFRFKLKKFESSYFLKIRNKFITLFNNISVALNVSRLNNSVEQGHSMLIVLKK
jgi:SAM-dependent methyltransferase